MSIYRCKSETCSDNGGVCTMIVHDMFSKPEKCPYPSAWEDFEEDCDCEWVELDERE